MSCEGQPQRASGSAVTAGYQTVSDLNCKNWILTKTFFSIFLFFIDIISF